MVKIDLRNHHLVPEHILLTEEEAEKVLQEYGVTREELPKILITDPIVKLLEREDENGNKIYAKPGDIVKIIRTSPTAGVEIAYRVVVER